LLIVLVVVVLRNGLVGAGGDLIAGSKQAGDG
jgi:hypothetical protein